MGAFIVFLINRIVFRAAQFIRDWYVGAGKIYGHFVISFFEKIDRVLAIKITMRHIFEPLYQDRSILGHILGFIFRSLRILIGGIVYIILSVVFFAGYLAWAAIPLVIILKIIKYKF